MSGVGPHEEAPGDQTVEGREPGGFFVRVVLLAGLVALVGLVSALPPERSRQAVTWVTTQDFDGAGRWAEVRAWAAGWGAALKEEVAGLVERLPKLPERPAWLGAPGAGAESNPAKPAAPAKTVAPAAEAAGPDKSGTPAPGAPARPTTLMPVRGKLLYDYGWLPQGQEPHGGLDFAAAIGEPVHAIADGTVLRIASDPALGGLVEVDHGFIIALYGQVAGSKVAAGDKVTQGQTLATIAPPTGKEGDREAHLHLEVRVTAGAKPVDPAPFLPMSAAPQGGDGN